MQEEIGKSTFGRNKILYHISTLTTPMNVKTLHDPYRKVTHDPRGGPPLPTGIRGIRETKHLGEGRQRIELDESQSREIRLRMLKANEFER